jgi:hypothetical protein
MRTYQNQFGYPIDSEASQLLALGLVDSSWGNDVCPSFTHEGLKILVWVDHPDQDMREIETNPRYCISQLDENLEICTEGLLCGTEDFQEVLQFISNAKGA